MKRVLFAILALALVHSYAGATDTDLTSREALNRLARFQSPGDLVDQINVNFTSATSATYFFGDGSWDMDYAIIFTETAACSIAPTLKSGRLDAAADIDSSYLPVPAGSNFVLSEQWAGFKIKGMGTGKIAFRAVGHVNE